MAGKANTFMESNYIWNVLLWWVLWPPSLCDYEWGCPGKLWEKVSVLSYQEPKWVFTLTWSSPCTWTDPAPNLLHWLTLALLFAHFHFVCPHLVNFSSLSMNFHNSFVHCTGKARVINLQWSMLPDSEVIFMQLLYFSIIKGAACPSTSLHSSWNYYPFNSATVI